MGVGAMAGAVIGGLLAVGALAGVAVFAAKQKKQRAAGAVGIGGGALAQRAMSASVFTKAERSLSDPEAVVHHNPLNTARAEEL
jgi:hypothetical protein